MIEIRNLEYQYPTSSEPILRGVNLTIEDGEFVVLTGSSGCGKTTLLHCLKGLCPHFYGGRISGQIVLRGRDLRDVPFHQLALEVGLVMQDPETQFCNLFVKDEITFGVENLRLPVDECRARLDMALKAVRLAGFENREVHQLSGGEKQRLALGSVLAMDPPLLVLDEPTANLDHSTSVEILDEIFAFASQGRTVLIVQHDLGDLVQRADRLIVMHEGLIVEAGAPRDVLERNGSLLTLKYGVGIPQVSSVAEAVRRDIPFERLPLSPEEFVAQAGRPTKAGPPGRTSPTSPRGVPSDAPLISLDRVSYSYPGAEQDAIQDISLTVAHGETVAIVGRSGSGKSTLARLMIGLLLPREGRVQLGDIEITRKTKRVVNQHAGYVFQYPEHQFVADRVDAEVAYGLEIKARPVAEIQSTVRDVLRLLNLEALQERHPFSLSGGEKRRLSVATMMVLHPKVLILDEPTYGLDEGNILNMVDFLFRRLLPEGVSVLLITHDMRLVAEQATRAVVIDGGRLVFDGTPAGLFADRQKGALSVLAPAPPVARLAAGLRSSGWPVEHDVISAPALVHTLITRGAVLGGGGS